MIKKAYPSTLQSFGIAGLVLVCMVLFAPLNYYLEGITSTSIAALIYYVCSMTTPFVIFHFLKKKEEGEVNYGLKPKSVLAVVLLTIVTLAIQWGVTSPIAELIPMPDFVQALLEDLTKDLNDIYGLIMVAFAAPILEELIFRGIILDGLLKRRSVLSAILISSFLFAFVHLNPWQFPAAMILGCFSGWVYFRTRNLIYSIIIHFVNNFGASALLFLFPEMENMDQSIPSIIGGEKNLTVFIIACISVTVAGIFVLNKTLKQEKEIDLLDQSVINEFGEEME